MHKKNAILLSVGLVFRWQEQTLVVAGASGVRRRRHPHRSLRHGPQARRDRRQQDVEARLVARAPCGQGWAGATSPVKRPPPPPPLVLNFPPLKRVSCDPCDQPSPSPSPPPSVDAVTHTQKKSASQAVLSRVQLTLHATSRQTRRIPHGI